MKRKFEIELEYAYDLGDRLAPDDTDLMRMLEAELHRECWPNAKIQIKYMGEFVSEPEPDVKYRIDDPNEQSYALLARVVLAVQEILFATEIRIQGGEKVHTWDPDKPLGADELEQLVVLFVAEGLAPRLQVG